MLLSMSSSVVFQPLTLTRMAVRPRQAVGPHQQVPSRWIAAMTDSVRAAFPKSTTTWLRTTSLSTLNPAWRMPSAKRRASWHVLPTRAATPSRPSAASTAHTSTPRARCDDWGVKCMGCRETSPGR